mmetsp:Transcript_20004/g.33140  ORF Transcript_20004/g.33140 Transcript_20004/m.33140 type:complete len:219 (+) Transcript_20004:1-657(+)
MESSDQEEEKPEILRKHEEKGGDNYENWDDDFILDGSSGVQSGGDLRPTITPKDGSGFASESESEVDEDLEAAFAAADSQAALSPQEGPHRVLPLGGLFGTRNTSTPAGPWSRAKTGSEGADEEEEDWTGLDYDDYEGDLPGNDTRSSSQSLSLHHTDSTLSPLPTPMNYTGAALSESLDYGPDSIRSQQAGRGGRYGHSHSKSRSRSRGPGGTRPGL